MDQGGSVPLVHIAAFDWPILPCSPPPASGRHSRDRRAGETCELNARRRLTDWRRGSAVIQGHKREIWLKWHHYEWSTVRYCHGADWMQWPRPRLPDGSLRSCSLVVIFGRYTDLFSADMGGAYYT